MLNEIPVSVCTIVGLIKVAVIVISCTSDACNVQDKLIWVVPPPLFPTKHGCAINRAGPLGQLFLAPSVFGLKTQ